MGKLQPGDQSAVLYRIEGTPYSVMDWNNFKVMFGGGRGPGLLNEFKVRMAKNKSVIILITGSPGEGKSYFALRFAQIFDKFFNPYLQIVFSRKHLLWLLGPESPLQRGQVIIIDEAQFIAGARRWYDEVQKDVMDHMEAIRSKGYIIIIVALHLDLLDKIIRKFVLSHMFHMEERGVARVYRVFTPRFSTITYSKKIGVLKLRLPDYEKCKSVMPDCLVCKHREECQTLRAIYERRKRNFLAEQALKAQRKEERKESKLKGKGLDVEGAIKYLRKHLATAHRIRGNRISAEWVQIMIKKKFNVVISRTKADEIRNYWEALHPEDFKKEK